MKKIFTLIASVAISSQMFAQPIISSGNPLVGINGNTYDSVAATGSGLWGVVANSKDGKLFATNNFKLWYIDPADFSVMDSMNINMGYFVGLQSEDTMFGFNNNGILTRFNTAAKTVIDTVLLYGQYHSRVTERPMAQEVWVGGNPAYVVNYTNAMTVTDSFDIGTNINSVKFASDGMTAYAASGVTKRIYIIDAANKVVTDSVDFSESPTAFALNADDTKMYVAATGKVRVYQTSNFGAIDSVMINMPVTNIYRHPSKPEMWCVHHFADSVSVFNADTYALIDSIPVGGSVHFLAFGQTGTGIKATTVAASDIKAFPNPVSDMLTVTCEGEATMEIYDVKGALMRTGKINGKSVVNVSAFPTGMYYIKATNGKGKVQVLKFNKL